MKIAMLVNNLSVSGGYQKLVLRLTQQFIKKGHKVDIYTLAINKQKCYPDIINQFNIIAPSKDDRARYRNELMALSKKMDKTGYDAIILHDDTTLRCLNFLPVNYCKKTIWMLNNEYPTNFGRVWSTVRKEASLFSKSKIPPIQIVPFLGLVKRCFDEKTAIKRVTNLVTYDEYNRTLIKKYLHRTSTNVMAGADLEHYKDLAEKRPSKQPQKTINILSVGVIYPHRRYEDILLATKYLLEDGLDAKTTIVGVPMATDYKQTLLDMVEGLKITNQVTFIDYAPQDDLDKLYQKASVFVFVNNGLTWGISVFEAMAAKIPVVVTNNIGAADLVKDNISGWIVPPKNPRRIAMAIKTIANNENVEKIINSAYTEVLPQVSWGAYCDRMLAVAQSKSED